jgi:lipopolysaccharide transport system permease protein
VIYPSSYLSAKWRNVLALNPMSGVVEGFRHALLGSPISWGPVGISLAVSGLLFVAGLFVFRRLEARFADVI